MLLRSSISGNSNLDPLAMCQRSHYLAIENISFILKQLIKVLELQLSSLDGTNVSARESLVMEEARVHTLPSVLYPYSFIYSNFRLPGI